MAVAKELMASLKAAIERGDEPPIGRTEKQVTGFRGRSGRTFRAKLRIEPRDDEPGKWRVEFDEEWAKEPPQDQRRGGDDGRRHDGAERRPRPTTGRPKRRSRQVASAAQRSAQPAVGTNRTAPGRSSTFTSSGGPSSRT